MMRRTRCTGWVTAAFCSLALFAPAARAEGMRCGSRLVSDGDPMDRVRDVCGAPNAMRQRTELRTVKRYVSAPCVQDRGGVRCGYVEEQTVQVVIDEWTYDFGPSTLVRYVTFEQGQLLRVTTGGYGTASAPGDGR